MNQYEDNRLTVVGIEVPDNQDTNPTGTKVLLSNGQYLGNVKNISLCGGVDQPWSVSVTTKALLTNEQVAEIFGIEPEPKRDAKGGVWPQPKERRSVNGQPVDLPKEEGSEKTTDS